MQQQQQKQFIYKTPEQNERFVPQIVTKNNRGGQDEYWNTLETNKNLQIETCKNKIKKHSINFKDSRQFRG